MDFCGILNLEVGGHMSDQSDAAMIQQAPTPVRLCPTCGREWGQGLSCQFCNQVTGLPTGVRLSSPGRRLGAHLLDGLLFLVTLALGWIVWSLIVWARGQTPAKQLLGMRVVKLSTARPAGWGTMFLREVVGKFVGGIAADVTLGILYFMLLWDAKSQEVWDKIAGTIVVDDAPTGATGV